ncbi:MAG: hypothetical protein K8R39_01005 [Arcobacteraceae bacterium]|nr:hypothetical protein [Arcobacteraceae bacterium]
MLPHIINVKIADGSTAYGLNNNNSSSQAINKFLTEVKRFKNYNTIIIQLGEVDCAYILWKKAKDYCNSARDNISISIKGYESLIRKLMIYNKKIIITGVILPTVKNGQKNSNEVPLRDTISATQEDRTTLVLEFNEQLKLIAIKYNLDYIDITEETINKDTSLVDDKFIIKDKVDHHQSQENTSMIWVSKLRNII